MINWKGKLMQSSIMPTVPNGKGRKIDLHTLAATIKEISRHPDQYTFIVENPGAHAPSAAGPEGIMRHRAGGYNETQGRRV